MIDNSKEGFSYTHIEGLDSLLELAFDMYWSWNHTVDEIWKHLDPDLWNETHNPWAILQTMSRDKIKHILADTHFRKKIEDLLEEKRKLEKTPAWFQKTHPNAPLRGIAYFSMEFMLTQSLPIYSGGLGNVAGDQLKAASDMGVPVIGIGLLYQHGYFHQVIDKNYAQEAYFPCNDFGQLPIMPLRKPNGEWLRIHLDLTNLSVWIRVWQIQVGRLKLYLLDSNDPANYPQNREITSELYGRGLELRFMQEIILGIAGPRLLAALGIEAEIYHLNEGHAAFAILERARLFMVKTGHPFEVALSMTRAGNIFTTHTAVHAGMDHFSPTLMEPYLGDYARQKLGISFQDLLSLGRRDPEDLAEHFNMAYLAIRGSRAINGVSQLHEKVSRRLFSPLFPRWPMPEIPIGHVTNGVHMPSWDSKEADELWTSLCGKSCWLETAEKLEHDISKVSDIELWQLRNVSSNNLIKYIRRRLSKQLVASKASSEAIAAAKQHFNPNVLTLAFARRFTTYKRPSLLLQDPERLVRLLTNPLYPVQLIVAGKAHPHDREGQALIQKWIHFIHRPEVYQNIIFLVDHDMLLTEQLVQGADIWLNTPKRPWEACGTSGMKVLVNGGINISELDGWWAEAYTPEVGWALGDGKESHDPTWDATEAEALYNILEQEVIPEFYNRNNEGIPVAWVRRMRASMSKLTPHFSANRVIREYVEEYYLPSAKIYLERIENNGAIGVQQVNWIHQVKQNWKSISFGKIEIKEENGKYTFQVQIDFGEFDPQYASVELYANDMGAETPQILEMSRLENPSGTTESYSATVKSNRHANDYTVRIIPKYPGLNNPLEVSNILWQR